MSTTLLSDRLQFKELALDDVPLIHSLNAIDEVARYNTIGIPQRIEETHNHLIPYIEDHQKSSRTKYAWIMRSIDDTSFIGLIGLNLSAPRYRRGEIYFSLLPKSWGKGYATEAAERVIEFGFDSLQLHRIEAGAATANIASLRVLEKIGMTREGIGRKILPLKDGWSDNYSYAILESEFRPESH